MKRHRRIGMILFTLSLAFAMLACGLGGSTEPTQVPAAEPTTAPAEPTVAAPEPTEAPVEEPTEEAPVEEPTEEVPVEEPTEEAPADTPADENPPAENALVITEVADYLDEYDNLYILGLVTNNTDRAVDSVEVEIEIFDANDNSLFVDITTVSLYTLAPGETSPFNFSIYEELPDADNYVATIVGQSAAEVERATVEIDGVTFVVDDSGNLHITGNLINNSGNPVQVDRLAAATFDADGNLYTADSHAVLVHYLDPGEDGPFRVTMTGPAGGTANIEEYELYIDAEVADPADQFELTFADTHYYYMDSYESFHLVGEITNNHDEFMTISLVGGIYDEDGNVLDAATTDVPTYSIAPGETLPYDFQYWGPLNYKSSSFASASSYTVQWDAYWTWTSSTEYIELTSQNDVNEVSSYQVTFTGEVLNNSGNEVDGATVIVSLYSVETGELVAAGYGIVYDPIAANATAEYTVWIDTPVDFDINSVEYVILVKGEIPN